MTNRAEARQYNPGDCVFTVLPLVDSPSQAKFSSPFSAVHWVFKLNYLIETPGHRKSSKLCQVNLLKHTWKSLFPMLQSSPAKPMLVSGRILSSPMSEPVVVEGEGVDIAPDVGWGIQRHWKIWISLLGTQMWSNMMSWLYWSMAIYHCFLITQPKHSLLSMT